MCGIVGAFGRRGTPEVVTRMSDSLPHRGPDDCGLKPLAAGGKGMAGGFGHRRLAIIDLSEGGHQPMSSPDGRWSIVFNGEIYNYKALRAELEAEGVRFRSTSDTEVLLEGWARHGRGFLPRLRGMYALAIWDSERGRGWLARDPFGIKPLYMASSDGTVFFASEIRALLASGMVAPRLDRHLVAAYLEAGSVPEPFAIASEIRSVPAGSVVEITSSDGGARAEAPVALVAPFLPSLPDEAIEDAEQAHALIRSALRDSVAHHLIADVPVGMFLSGGIDSSALVGLASEVSSAPLDTFTVVFDEADFSERQYAEAVARRFNTRHSEIPLSGARMLESLPAAFAAMDMPSMDGLNTYAVSEGVRKAGLKVVLSGLGGDELFAGYPSFARARELARMWPLVRPTRGLLQRLAPVAGRRIAEKATAILSEQTPASAAYRASRTLFSREFATRLAGAAGPRTGTPAPAGLSLLGQVSWYEATGYMRSTLLRDSDVFSMAHGLELRVPFVDVEVAAASMRISDRLKLGGGSKPLLVGAVRDLLPREVWDRPKQGFALPFAHWLQGPLRDEVASALSATRLERVGVSPRLAQQVWTGFLRNDRRFSWSRPWALYTLVRWAEQVGASVDSHDDAALALPAGISG